MPATSLSPLAAKTPDRCEKVNVSCMASTVAATPAGLWEASMMMVGLRLMTSSRPGVLTLANASRTRSASSISVPSSETPANASTAASAQAALPAWKAPNTGRKMSS